MVFTSLLTILFFSPYPVLVLSGRGVLFFSLRVDTPSVELGLLTVHVDINKAKRVWAFRVIFFFFGTFLRYFFSVLSQCISCTLFYFSLGGLFCFFVLPLEACTPIGDRGALKPTDTNHRENSRKHSLSSL